MVAHDDYSLISKLPKHKTSVVTILRDPIDRVFSTYEFSMEVAARFLVHPNLTSATQMSRRIRPKSRGVSTLDIWPWKYLVPWMRQDLFERVCFSSLRCLLASFLFLHYFCFRLYWNVLGSYLLERFLISLYLLFYNLHPKCFRSLISKSIFAMF